MTKLEKLLTEYCPNGVNYSKLSSVCDIISGFPFDSSEFSDSGIRLMRGMNIKRGYLDFSESNNRYWKTSAGLEKYEMADGDIVIAMDGSLVGKSFGMVKKEELPLLLVQRVARLRVCNETANNRYIYHCITNKLPQYVDSKKTEGAIPHISLKDISNFIIPLPPLEVQAEIVRILDSFTKLTAELTAELTARKKQYEYYRNELLHLDGDRLTIQELFDTRNGFTPSKNNPDFWENGTLPWFKVDDINERGRVLSESNMHITPSALKKSGLFPENSIIISTSATIGEYALITVPFLCNQRFTCLSLKSKYKNSVNIKYLMHYCPMLSTYCKEHLNQGNFASVDMKQFAKFEFVIPDLKEQNRIVSILDRFDKLCNGISEGLPAEIEARRKQYEYYRDKLLSFEEEK